MPKIASLTLVLLFLTLFASPAFCQDAGSYQDYLLPAFDQSEVNCAAQPTNQYYNPDAMQLQQQPQFYQIVSPTRVCQDQSDGQGYSQAAQQNFSGQNLSAYQQQEMALQQSEMAQQLEDAKNKQQAEESFRMSSEFNDKSLNDPNSGTKKNKAKGVASSMGRMVKGGLKYATPAAGTVASVFLLRAAFGNSMMAMPIMGGGMMVMPGP